MFVRVNGAGWAVNDKLTSAQINALDTDHAKAVDGFGGGSYAPSAELDVLGSGLGRTLPALGGTRPWDTFDNDTSALLGSAARRDVVRVTSCVQALFATAWNQIITSVPQAAHLQGTADATHFAMVPLDGVDAATLQQVVVRFAIVGGHGSLPAVFPAVQVLAVKNDGTVTVLTGTTITAGTIAAYEALTSITLTPATLADRTQYKYWLRILDENGAGSQAGNKFHSATTTSVASKLAFP